MQLTKKEPLGRRGTREDAGSSASARPGLRGHRGYLTARRSRDRHIQEHHVNLDAVRAKQSDSVSPIGGVECFEAPPPQDLRESYPQRFVIFDH